MFDEIIDEIVSLVAIRGGEKISVLLGQYLAAPGFAPALAVYRDEKGRSLLQLAVEADLSLFVCFFIEYKIFSLEHEVVLSFEEEGLGVLRLTPWALASILPGCGKVKLALRKLEADHWSKISYHAKAFFGDGGFRLFVERYFATIPPKEYQAEKSLNLLKHLHFYAEPLEKDVYLMAVDTIKVALAATIKASDGGYLDVERFLSVLVLLPKECCAAPFAFESEAIDLYGLAGRYGLRRLQVKIAATVGLGPLVAAVKPAPPPAPSLMLAAASAGVFGGVGVPPIGASPGHPPPPISLPPAVDSATDSPSVSPLAVCPSNESTPKF